MSIYNILLFISYLCLATGYNAVDIYEDAYYEDDYEENNEKDKPRIHGYYKNVGGGVLKIKNMLVDEAYVNETIDYYDCVPRRLINVLKVEEEEVEEFQSIESQIQDLKKKMTEINVISNAIAEGIDPRTAKEMGRNAVAEAEEGNNTKSAIDGEEEEGSSKKREKRVSFREKQTMKMQEKREKEAARELVRPKYRLGADCESLVCGSCKVIVDEFAFMVHAGIDDQEKRYIEDLTVDFCQSKSIAIKYNDMVHDICKNFEEDSKGYKEALMQPFEEDDDWDNVLKPDKIFSKRVKVCTEIGACDADEFKFYDKPQKQVQEHWDDKCFVCQAFAKELELVVHLMRHVTERSVVDIVAATCDRLNLPPKYREVCQPLIEGKLLDDISWLTKVHGESIVRKAKGELRFPDKLCEEIDYCQPWIEPEKLKEKQAQQQIEAVFF